MPNKPIAVTMGEPSGIASEIILKTWLSRKKNKIHPFFLIDDLKKLEKINKTFQLNVKIHPIKKPSQTLKLFKYSLPVLDMKANLDFKLGNPNKKNCKFVIQSIIESLDLVIKKEACAILTLPVCKTTLKKSGFKFNGQTEYISHLCKKYFKKKNNEIMILSTNKPIDMGKNLIVGLITTHEPIKDFLKKINKRELIKKIYAFNFSLQKIWGFKIPKIGICSINPHAGEDGLVGNEENKIIIPVIKKLRKENIKLYGPLSSDSCFFKDKRKKYDGILCFYHDQGLAPIKILDFYNSINITGGIPILRVSPDHGPAFDIASSNIAKIDSLVSSIKFIERFSK